jgi:hypothetical protein
VKPPPSFCSGSFRSRLNNGHCGSSVALHLRKARNSISMRDEEEKGMRETHDSSADNDDVRIPHFHRCRL